MGSRFNPKSFLSSRPAEGSPPGFGDMLGAGRVLKVYPNKYMASVYIFAGYKKGVTTDCHVRCLHRNYQTKASTVFMPEIGDLIYVDWRFGAIPQLVDYYPLPAPPENDIAYSESITPIRSVGGEDDLFKTADVASYRPGATDLMPGDKIIMGNLGNFLGILSGGLSILRASKLAQIILNKAGDLVQVISRRATIISDFGEVNFRNDNGSTSLEILGKGGDQESNKHAGPHKYEIRIGGKMGLFYMNLANLFRLMVDAGGNLLLTANKATVKLQSPPSVEFAGSSHLKIGGTRSVVTDNDDYSSTAGTRTRKMSKSISICSGPKNEVVSGPCSTQYQSTVAERIQGTAPTSLSTIAKETVIAAGDYDISIGNPAQFGTPCLPLAGKSGSYNVRVYNGNVSHEIMFTGDHSTLVAAGNIDHMTFKGNATLYSAIGDVSVSTGKGNATLSTYAGDLDVSTLKGDAYFGTKVGDTTIEAFTGKITLKAGTTLLEMGPTGIKFSNGSGSFELLDTLIELCNQLVAAGTPGYGGPLSTSAVIGGKVLSSLTGIKGA